jgi:hypothetical protein
MPPALYRHRHASQVLYYQEILEKAGIPTFVKNAVLDAALAGAGNTLTDWFPSLHVMHAEDYVKARALIQEVEASSEDLGAQPDWVCAQCQESVPSSFATCWKCGNPHETIAVV